MHLHSNYHALVAYYDPVWTAENLIANEQPVPVDLQEELMRRGVDVNEMQQKILGTQAYGLGMSVEDINGQ